MREYKVVILGAGPTGLGAGYRLKELSETDFKIFEARDYAGGLAASFKDDNGFWWDIGGHVQFSHYKYFDDLMDKLLGNDWLSHQRESWVWLMDRFIPYPYQLNIHRLPKNEMKRAVLNLIDQFEKAHQTDPKNFHEWIEQTSGTGIAEQFLEPYNFKVWAHPTEMMNSTWVGERVARTDLKRVISNVLDNKDDVSWGPNSTFRFPLQGGTGKIWRSLADLIGEEFIELNMKAVKINTKKHIITFDNGDQVKYEKILSTIPLDKFVSMTDFDTEVKKKATELKHSSTYIVGVGLAGKPKEDLKEKCWMYFPESNCPFYRVTLFSKYSPNNVPDKDKYWSLMTETAASEFKPVNPDTIIDETIEGLINTKLISPKNKIVSTWLHYEPYGYPTPSVERDSILAEVQPVLMQHSIYSRGRFGMWKYEVSNQDHSLMQGVEAVTHMLYQSPEITAWYPSVVNGPKPY